MLRLELSRDVQLGSLQVYVMVVNIIINRILDSGMGYRYEEFYVPALFYAGISN